jgi:hydroxymethylbilane synthase
MGIEPGDCYQKKSYLRSLQAPGSQMLASPCVVSATGAAPARTQSACAVCTMTMPPAVFTIATRESRLAMWQAEHVQALLTQAGAQVHLLGMTTRGDQILDRSLSKVGGKGLFVKELEAALADGRADLAVHSLKDVPMDLPDGMALACVMAREDPRDALVSPRYASLDALPHGAVVGTSSLRRVVLLKSLRPDLRIEPLRGNLDTRLRKLDEGSFDAIVLARAGLVRLGLAHRIASTFEPHQMLPAAGQGALGIEVAAARADVAHALAPLGDTATWLAVEAERAVSRALGGSCSVPLAAYAVWDTVDGASGSQRLVLQAAWGDITDVADPWQHGARRVLVAHGQAAVGSMAEARSLGEQVAGLLRAQGAGA